ncbi:MAG: Flp pilus assembly complex ATPase component TadA, partial [Candidatus Omnitrophica bacterium]|nr:Flp pilus assembly complex ATPase component TadA [Candidatus Omnitrophota bacterium]
MSIENIKKQIRRQISMGVGESQKLTRAFIQERVRQIFENMRKEKVHHLNLDSSAIEKIIDSLCDDFLGLGPLQKLMEDAEITEIMVNGPYRIYIEKKGRKVLSDVKFDDEAHLKYIIEKMLSPTGRRVDESFPYTDFSLADGSRVNVIIHPLTVGGAAVTIRKFLR